MSVGQCMSRPHPRCVAEDDSRARAERLYVCCHACGCAENAVFLAARGYTVVRCKGCGLAFVNPQPSDRELDVLYGSHDQGDQWHIHEDRFNHAVRGEISRFCRSGSVLDVGCGAGDFLRVMREGGFSVAGVERSERGWQYATRSYGLDVFHGSVEDFFAAGRRRSFDVITILNVLEHLKHPRATLESLAALSTRHGLLVVVVPDARLHAMMAKLRKVVGCTDPFWMDSEYQPVVAIDPPYHLTCFEPRTLRRLIEGCGYRIVKLANAPVISNPERWKRVLKAAVAAAGKFAGAVTFGKLVVGYSTIAIAQKR